MARIIPNSPIRQATSAHLRVHRLLKALPEGRYTVWQRLPTENPSGPDFWILGRDRRSMFIKVCPAPAHDEAITRQPQLFTPQISKEPPGRREQADVDEFMARLAEIGGERQPPPIPCALLFPHLANRDLDRILPGKTASGTTWTSREIMLEQHFLPWLEENLSRSLAPEAIETVRQMMAPEVVIPPELVARHPSARKSPAGKSRYLLDLLQEEILKTDLGLWQEDPAVAPSPRVRLVNGVAGSGKSLIVACRERLLRQLYPKKRLLVLAHSRPLIRDLQAHCQALGNTDETTEWSTLMDWCHRYGPKIGAPSNMVAFQRRREIISRVRREHLQQTRISEGMLLEEIDWFKDRLLFNRSDYLAADRTGRGFHLSESMRLRVYEAIKAYNRELGELKSGDWGDLPRYMLRALVSKKVKIPAYDAILVDETQFFAPIWFDIIKRILRPDTGTLFMVADPDRGFLKRKLSWLTRGLEVRGHVQCLEKSYRTIRETLAFATLLHRSHTGNENQADGLTPPDLLDMPGGTLPVVIPLSGPREETTRVVNEIEILVKTGVPPGDILLIHATHRGIENIITRLTQRLGPDSAARPGDAKSSGYLRVTALNDATDLESPIVFLVGGHALYEKEQSIRISEDERAALIRENTRKLYRACTSAGQQLFLTYVGILPRLFKGLTG